MSGLGRRSTTSVSPFCSAAGCDLPHYAKDLCSKHYSRLQYRYESNADNEGKHARSLRTPPPALCSRCTTQVEALAADSGWGDRVAYFRSLTGAQLAAYMLGYFDGQSGDGNAVAKVTAVIAGIPVKWWKAPLLRSPRGRAGSPSRALW